jgi:hypothetical protein
MRGATPPLPNTPTRRDAQSKESTETTLPLPLREQRTKNSRWFQNNKFLIAVKYIQSNGR